MNIRKAELEDIPELTLLVNSAYRGDSSRIGWTTEADLLGGQRIDEDGLRELLCNPKITILCMNEAGSKKILACVELSRMDQESFLLGMLSVTPQLQNQGLGSQLMTFAETFAKNELGARKMVMKVISLRTELIAYYERKSYRLKSEYEKFPYGDRRFGLPKREDLQFVRMEKTL